MKSIEKQYDVYRTIIHKVHTIKIFLLCVGIDAIINRSTSIIIAEGVPHMSTHIRTHSVTHLNVSTNEDKYEVVSKDVRRVSEYSRGVWNITENVRNGSGIYATYQKDLKLHGRFRKSPIHRGLGRFRKSTMGHGPHGSSLSSTYGEGSVHPDYNSLPLVGFGREEPEWALKPPQGCLEGRDPGLDFPQLATTHL
jgi:hypothetical protein